MSVHLIFCWMYDSDSLGVFSTFHKNFLSYFSFFPTNIFHYSNRINRKKYVNQYYLFYDKINIESKRNLISLLRI